MKTDKLEEQVDLKCPHCGGTEFDLDAAGEPDDVDAEPEADTLLQCVQCNKEITYGALVAANADNIEQHVQAIGEDFAEGLKQNLLDAIKKIQPK